MTNDAFTEKISLWLDDQLSSTEVAELKAHLSDCPTCRQTYAAMRQVDQLFRTAAMQMAAPAPGFSQRFEARLAHHRVTKPWQLWLAVTALILGAFCLFGAGAILGGITLLDAGIAMLDARVLYQGLAALIESIENLRVFINLIMLFLKASFITMQQPLFWGGVVIAMSMIVLWLRVMQTLSKRAFATVELVL